MASAHPSLSAFSSQLLSAMLVGLLLLLPVDAQNRSDEVRALLSFKEAYSSSGDGAINYWSTWKQSDENPCQWLRITCTGNSTVSGLVLSSCGLTAAGDRPINLAMLSKLRDLQQLDLSRNYFRSSMPEGVDSLTQITLLDLSDNWMSGMIPQSISACRSLRSLHLENNLLEGDIGSLNGLVNLQILGLAGNCFSDPFPKELVELNHLVTLDLSQNYLNAIPALPHLSSLVELDLSNNSFAGFEEDWLLGSGGANSSNSSLQFLSVSFNQLQGMIPPSITNLRNLKILEMSGNRISGRIPFGFSQLVNQVWLDLSQNQLSGNIPDDLLVQQSGHNNHLFGALPAIRQNSSLLSGNATIFDGNPGICGTPLPRACPSPGSGVPRWVLLVTISGSLTIALLSCLAATWRWRVYRRRHQQDADLIKTVLERDSATLMTLRELRKATSDFAESAQIGQGGFATVYRGQLNDGATVAIKKSNRQGSEKDKEQFLNEVRILSLVNHRNLVKLIGCCMENKVALLVFEYVSNGTLQEHLQGKMGAIRLTWEQRLKIAVQTADALYYLHTAATFPIYHRDVKSANILLNDDLDAKVADFGISRLAPLQATHVSTAAVQGTLGYIDPEYYTSFRLTDKSDVYSLGVVLLELISAKPAVDFLKVGDESNLVILARPYIERGNLEGLIDPALTETYCDSTGHGRESILNVGRLAMECAEMRSKARPSMSEVLQELQNLWVMLNGRTTDLDSMRNEDDADAHRDHLILLSESLSGDSCSLTIGEDTHGVELSQFSNPRGFQ